MPADLTAEYVRSVLDYWPDTGSFTWRERPDCGPRWNGRYPGKVAGARRDDGYIVIRIDGWMYYGHRLAWLWMTGAWPTEEIDHRDVNPSNNLWANLRIATGAENKHNIGIRPINSSGFKGVSFYHPTGRWRARIKVNNREVSLGYYATKAEARAAYARGAKELHGEFARVA